MEDTWASGEGHSANGFKEPTVGKTNNLSKVSGSAAETASTPVTSAFRLGKFKLV